MNTLLNREFHVLLGRAGFTKEDKEDMIYRHTAGRTTSAKDLKDIEARELTGFLRNIVCNENMKCDRLRKTLISMGYQIGWCVAHTKEYWEKHGVGGQKKAFNAYTAQELMKAIKTMETILRNYGVRTDITAENDLIEQTNTILHG